jgi:indolepyruvate ferredoxin oxidoreductase, beta subunit
MNLPERPITVLIAALGGEGGGVMADWIIAAANLQGYPVQSTSIPGVAQRTGATTYYLEIYPARLADLGERRPVLALTPSPGNVDLMVASELLEAARAMQSGYVSPERTTLIASTHRIYTTQERMQMGDGRIDAQKILRAGGELARRALLFDMAALAQRSGTVINAVLLGAMAGSGVLPLPKSALEAAIREAGKGVEGSLRGFELGYRTATGEANPPQPEEVRRWHDQPLERVRQRFPAETHRIVEEGASRTLDFQGPAYASLYLDRVEAVLALDREQGGGAAGYGLTNETARFLALWMCYEDVIRVADLKTRRSRVARVRAEVLARPEEPVHIVEYFKPGVEEIAAILPARWGAALERWAARRRLTLQKGLYIRSTSIHGFLMLRFLAALRPLRPRSLRYGQEQQTIERWLDAIRSAAARDLPLARELALTGRLIKGYGETYRRGRDNFLRILETLVEDAGRFASDSARTAAVRAAREAALADPEGRRLETTLEGVGIAPLPPKAKPVQFIRKRPAGARA